MVGCLLSRSGAGTEKLYILCIRLIQRTLRQLQVPSIATQILLDSRVVLRAQEERMSETPPSPTSPTERLDCSLIQVEYKKCAALQYDRWLHPSRHSNAPPDYDECTKLFEGWKSCVLKDRQRK